MTRRTKKAGKLRLTWNIREGIRGSSLVVSDIATNKNISTIQLYNASGKIVSSKISGFILGLADILGAEGIEANHYFPSNSISTLALDYIKKCHNDGALSIVKCISLDNSILHCFVTEDLHSDNFISLQYVTLNTDNGFNSPVFYGHITIDKKDLKKLMDIVVDATYNNFKVFKTA